MKTNLIRILIFSLLLITLTGCQLGQGKAAQSMPTAAPTAEPTLTPTLRPTRTPAPTATATPDPEQVRQEAVKQAAQAYFDSVAAGDLDTAAGLISNYSMVVFGLTRGDVESALHLLHPGGASWSDLEIGEINADSQATLLVNVSYTLTTPDEEGKDQTETREEAWPFREESGEWRYNWRNLIDYRTLDVAAQTMNGMTVKPVQANRFSDRIAIVMMVQNRTSSPVVFGQINEILGTFTFGGETIEAEPTQTVFNPQRTVPDYTIEVKGYFTAYPDSLAMRKWKTYNVIPWYVFQLQ